MTREEILAMPAGPEMDAAIEELVLGQKLDRFHEGLRQLIGQPIFPGQIHVGYQRFECALCGRAGDAHSFRWEEPCQRPAQRPYSTEIAPAWTVVERMAKVQPPGHAGPAFLHGLALRACDDKAPGTPGSCWSAQFCTDFGYTPAGRADTAPLAICRAALMAVCG